jgi:DNA polymerase III alpha subunit
MRLPKFELPREFDDPFKYLVHLAKEGMRRIGWDKSAKHIEALKKELGDIRVAKEMNEYDFATYFLIVWDYINHARSKGIVIGCGRGSGYASVLLRCLGVTYGPDPLEYNLYWERFLGFDTRRFVRAADLGYVTQKVAAPLELEADDEDDLDEAREVEDDFGGVDRY